MDRDAQHELIRRLLAQQDDPSQQPSPSQARIDVQRYLDPAIAEQERTRIFRRYPMVVAHQDELEAPGSVRRVEVAGVPLILVRDGEIRAFVNACRHRGARLVDEAQCRKKAFTCPYHAWSYRLDGSLMHVPRAESFADLDYADFALKSVACEVRHGLVWVQLDGEIDVASHLGELDADFASFGLGRHRCLQTRVHDTAANWKLVMDAFAEGYHLRSLHRTSLSRFFLDPSILDGFAPHVRQCGIRKGVLDVEEADWSFRDHTTLFYNLFPNAIVVFHPRFISWLSLHPKAVDRVEFVHRMLVPEDLRTQEQRDRANRSYEHIDGQVFANEDLYIAQSIQSTLASGANTDVTLGALEEGMRLFHAAWDEAIRGA